MNFEDIYNELRYNEGKYIDIRNNKIFNNVSETAAHIKKIPICPIVLDIEAQTQTLDYYLSTNKASIKYVEEKKIQLADILKIYGELKNKDDFEEENYKYIVSISNVISEEFEEFGLTFIEDYFTEFNYCKYLKQWCDDNGINYEVDNYDNFVRNLKCTSSIFDWKEDNVEKIMKYEKIIDIKIPTISKYYYIDYNENFGLITDEKIILNIVDKNTIFSNILENGNWKPWHAINKKVREKLQEISIQYSDFYLVYNATEKKYNFYNNKSTKNKIIVFRYHEYDANNECVIYIKTIMI